MGWQRSYILDELVSADIFLAVLSSGSGWIATADRAEQSLAKPEEPLLGDSLSSEAWDIAPTIPEVSKTSENYYYGDMVKKSPPNDWLIILHDILCKMTCRIRFSN